MTLCGGWSIATHRHTGTTAITLWCRSWLCTDCAPKRIAALKHLAMDGQPTTFITLTVNPKRGQSPAERAQELSDAWKVVVKRARRKWTKAPLEYLAVFEETKKGEPHLHILARAPYIPQAWLSEAMNELIAAPIVDIRRVGAVANAARYVAKYVGKGPKAFAALKRYWSSKNYGPKAKEKLKPGDPGYTCWHVYREPLVVLREKFIGWGRACHWVSPHELFSPIGEGGPTGSAFWDPRLKDR